MSARNIHFGKSDVSFTLFRAVGEAHVKEGKSRRQTGPLRAPCCETPTETTPVTDEAASGSTSRIAEELSNHGKGTAAPRKEASGDIVKTAAAAEPSRERLKCAPCQKNQWDSKGVSVSIG